MTPKRKPKAAVKKVVTKQKPEKRSETKLQTDSANGSMPKLRKTDKHESGEVQTPPPVTELVSQRPTLQDERREDQPNIYGERKDKLADRLRAKRDPGIDTAPHLIIQARAGCGKTTTMIGGVQLLRGVTPEIEPSEQQRAIWDSILLSQGKASTVCMVAFNKPIAEELKRRVPPGVEACTMHSLGFKSVTRAFGNVKVNSYRVQDIVSELLERDIRDLRRTKPIVIKAVEELVGLCKMNLIGWSARYGVQMPLDQEAVSWPQQLSDLASYYDVDLNSSSGEIFSLVPRVLERCKDVSRDNCVDFNDMIFLPVALDLNVQKFDLLLVDEAQDLNRCQQSLAKTSGRRLIFCGDEKQSVYGFAGADSQSMARLLLELNTNDNAVQNGGKGCQVLPLTVTRRCGKAIVKEAQRFVPDFEAHETCGPGKISRANYQGVDRNVFPIVIDGKPVTDKDDYQKVNYRCYVHDGDMVLCRCNSPLVSECFKFLKAGRKANIQGRDVGAGLIKTINRMKAESLPQLLEKLSDWCHQETSKEQAKRNPSESKLLAIGDRYSCLLAFCEEQTTVAGVVAKIESVFTDDKTVPGIRLSSIHKSKGLESSRVFLLQPKGAEVCPEWIKNEWEREQCKNLLYVAITRAQEELVYVS